MKHGLNTDSKFIGAGIFVEVKARRAGIFVDWQFRNGKAPSGATHSGNECAEDVAPNGAGDLFAVFYKDVAPTALANLPEYRNLSERVKLVNEVADELKIKSPLHSD